MYTSIPHVLSLNLTSIFKVSKVVFLLLEYSTYFTSLSNQILSSTGSSLSINSPSVFYFSEDTSKSSSPDLSVFLLVLFTLVPSDIFSRNPALGRHSLRLSSSSGLFKLFTGDLDPRFLRSHGSLLTNTFSLLLPRSPHSPFTLVSLSLIPLNKIIETDTSPPLSLPTSISLSTPIPFFDSSTPSKFVHTFDYPSFLGHFLSNLFCPAPMSYSCTYSRARLDGPKFKGETIKSSLFYLTLTT